eukprot:SAG11_NODE_21188_length_430_cov_0.719033_1_plen_71_part_00
MPTNTTLKPKRGMWPNRDPCEKAGTHKQCVHKLGNREWILLVTRRREHAPDIIKLEMHPRVNAGGLELKS